MSGDGPGAVLRFPDPGGRGDAASRELVPAVEALLFASGEPVRLAELCEALDEPDPDRVREALAILSRRYEHPGSGLELVEVAGGWQLRTDLRFGEAILRLRGTRPRRLSQPALEVLAVVAYRQPATRREVEELRGVDSGGVLRTLVDRGLLRVRGRRAEPGRPLEYATTRAFLELFSLADLDELPTLEELESLERDRDPGEDGG